MLSTSLLWGQGSFSFPRLPGVVVAGVQSYVPFRELLKAIFPFSVGMMGMQPEPND